MQVGAVEADVLGAGVGRGLDARGNAESAVEVRDLVKVYPQPGGGVLKALNGVSFQVRRGEIFGFLGPNGAGKTTALEIVEGIRKPTSGKVRVLSVDPRRELDKVKEIIGVQLQSASYFSLLTIEEILDLFGSFYPRRRPTAELLDIVGGSSRSAGRTYGTCPAGSSDGSLSPPPWSTTLRSSSWTSRRRAWTRRCGAACGS